MASQAQQEQRHVCITEQDCATLAKLERDYGVPQVGILAEDEKELQRIREAIASCKSCKVIHLSNWRLHF